ncbi:ABC transporter substrate-binding protein [Saccharopolyspora cebuensis]|uniref:ABC transporter substrate-binding protein n=1 Tax=Saccharopolyspora cebuensis TaxID=418759 RepID=A0ABV4CP11_9PSEU
MEPTRPTRALVPALALVLTGCAVELPTAPADVGAPEVRVVDPAAAVGATGEVTVCGPRDTGVYTTLVESFTASRPGLSARYVELGADTDYTRTQAIQRLEGGSTECDIYVMDVTWVGEWASQGWVLDQSELVAANRHGLIPTTLDTAFFDGRYWATPFHTNAGLLFYRRDRVPPPTTWRQVYAEAAREPGNRLEMQAKPYEGLTVNFLELLYSAGGSVLSDDGEVTVDSPQTREVLRTMTGALRDGAIDRASLTYEEDNSRRAFESGAAGYLRQWPSAHALIEETDVGDSVAVAPLPAFDAGAEPASVLGGWNMAIAASSTNVGGAVALIDHATGPEFQKRILLEHSQAPAISATYRDPEVLARVPFAAQLAESVANARPRPRSPVYAQLSRAIYTNVHDAISGQSDVESAVRRMVEDLEAAQETF